MTFRPKVLAWLAASSLVLVGSVATAASDPVIDQKAGSLGRVIGIRIVTPGSRDHASYHGFVRTKPPLGDPETYYWGGSSCPAQKLTEAQVGVLVDALRDHQQLQVRPYYTLGEAADRCLMAFDLVAG
ncbi:MAG: hypothetical protein H6712_00420 [Myxococcales bacterium]|nr:hypothetical protein [Myxococcales bacterium]MCB9712289.1 hypothetical protein [Myxococcales bacterium]